MCVPRQSAIVCSHTHVTQTLASQKLKAQRSYLEQTELFAQKLTNTLTSSMLLEGIRRLSSRVTTDYVLRIGVAIAFFFRLSVEGG